MKRIVAASVLIASVACEACTGNAKQAYPACYQTSNAPICASRGDDISAKIGIESWREIYSSEWPNEMINYALTHTAIFFGPESRRHCPPNTGGCVLDLGSSTVATLYADTRYCSQSTGECKIVDPWSTALQHELTHMAEHWIDGVDDYEHDNKPYRWSGMLPTGARRLWCYQQTNKEECMELY